MFLTISLVVERLIQVLLGHQILGEGEEGEEGGGGNC